MNNAIIEFKYVHRDFDGHTALAGLNFTLKAGARCALLGPNGSGKSTLIRLLTGALTPSRGQVAVMGLEPGNNQQKIRASLGVLPEGAPLVPDLTVMEHLTLAAELRALDKKVFKVEVDRLTEGLNLGEFLHRLCGVLSQGSRRRAALAACLMGRPKILVLDEPSSGLDPQEAWRLKTALNQLPPETTLIISSHILSELPDITQEAVLLRNGALIAQGPWKELAAPGRDLNEAYLRLMTINGGENERHN